MLEIEVAAATVHQAERVSLESIRSFLQASKEIRFKSQSRQQRYAWVEQLLVQQQYATLGKADRGLVRRYIAKMTGLHPNDEDLSLGTPARAAPR